MRKVKYAGIQMQCCNSVEENIKTADRLVHTAAGNGANIILLPELFERPYFCQERNYDYYSYATTVEDNPAIQHFKKVAAKLGVVLPISFYERDVNVPLLMLMVQFFVSTVKPIFLMTITIRKNSILHREIPALRYGIPDMQRLVSVSAGTSGFLKLQDVWQYRGLKYYCILLQSVQNLFLRLTACRTGEDVCRDIQRAI